LRNAASGGVDKGGAGDGRTVTFGTDLRKGRSIGLDSRGTHAGSTTHSENESAKELNADGDWVVLQGSTRELAPEEGQGKSDAAAGINSETDSMGVPDEGPAATPHKRSTAKMKTNTGRGAEHDNDDVAV